MKLFKSLLLGSAAGLIAVSGASAADLGVKKPAPVEYVKVCSAHGAGFFYIPGSDTCLQISGRVRAEYLYKSTSVRGEDASGFRAHGRVNFDVRTTTEYGLLRTFIRLDTYGNNGNYLPPSASAASNFTGAASAVNRGGMSTSGFGNTYLDKAFIQWYTGTAGFVTAGRTVSFFDFYANSFSYSDVLIGSDNGNSNLFAYTFTFGGGFSATLSVEDPAFRRVAGAPLGNLQAGVVLGTNVGSAGNPGLATDVTGITGNTLAFAGMRLPEIVANLRVDQTWGSAQLSGVLHQINSANWAQPVTAIAVAANGNVAVAVNALAPARYTDTEYGWAIQGGVKINLPMLAAGDQFYLQAAYGQGAQSYVMGGGLGNQNVTGAIVSSADAYVDAFGNLQKATSWSVLAGLQHYFTPSIRAAVSAGYGKTNYSGLGANRVYNAPAAAITAFPQLASLQGSRSGYVDFSYIGVHGVLEWIPVRNFTIGISAHWQRLDPTGDVLTSTLNANGGQGGPTAAGAAVIRRTGSEDTFLTRIRFERSF